MYQTNFTSSRKEGNKKQTEEGSSSIKRFYGPPTSCSELGDIGHTLNGYYLVKSELASHTSKIQTIYCRFNQPQETIKGIIDK